MANGFEVGSVATLGMGIDSSQARGATKDLKDLTSAGNQLETSTRKWQRATDEGWEARKRERAVIREQAAAYQALRATQEAARSSDAARTKAIDDWVAAAKREVQLARDLAEFNREIARSGIEAEKAVPGMGRFQNAVNNLGFAFLGVQGPMSKVIEFILALSIGGAAVTGILAGVAAMGYAFVQLTEQTRAAQRAYDDYMASLRKQTPLGVIGAQLDEIQKKIDRYNEGGFLGGATRFTRNLLSRSVLGQLLGVKSIQELTDEVKTLGTQYDQTFHSIQDAARATAKTVQEVWASATLSSASALQQLEKSFDTWMRGRDRARQLFTISSVTGGRGPTPGPTRDDVYRDVLDSTRGLNIELPRAVTGSKEIAENWQSASASIANAVTLLANGDDALSRWLATTVAMVGQIEDISTKLAANGGKISATDAIGLGATGLSFLAGAFTETATQRRSREIMEQNNARLGELKRSLDSSTLAITGTGYTTARGGVNALLGAGPGQFIKNLGGVNLDAVKGVLAGVGTNYTDLKKFAEQLGITLDTANVSAFIKSLEKMREAINATALVTLKTFGGQLDLLTRRNALTGAGPLAQITDLLKLIQSPVGAPALGKLLGAFNLGTGSGRQGALDAILAQLDRAKNGQLTTAELGGLTLPEYLNTLSQFGGLLNQMNEQIKSTVDSLREFGKSLALDQQLTILTPGQQLEEARRRYEDVVAAARTGDQAAAGRLPEVARQFLELSRAYNASSPAYIADYQRVQQDVENTAKLYEGMLDRQESVVKNTAETNTRLREIETKFDVVIDVLTTSALSNNTLLEKLGIVVEDGAARTKRALEGMSPN